ncbi:hypothetical protein GCM10009823_26230 [Brevibacterium salitolerans]|uniref:Uncharacterized protein n=1 Tax=Brevibacterium salitolerans TaxID=1403566 RepID=A0ABN2X0F6_9MICO
MPQRPGIGCRPTGDDRFAAAGVSRRLKALMHKRGDGARLRCARHRPWTLLGAITVLAAALTVLTALIATHRAVRTPAIRALGGQG